MDIREQGSAEDFDEIIRVALGSHGRQMWSNVRVMVAEDSKDGHRVNLQPITQMQVRDQTGAVSQMNLPMLLDCPIQFLGGGGTTRTHMVKKGDEGTAPFSSTPIDVPMQQGGIQAQIDGRMHALADASFHPGGRSDPRKLDKVSTKSDQNRSDDNKHVADLHPTNGHTFQSEKMVLAQVGDNSAHMLSDQGFRATAPKVLLNC